MFDIKKQLLWSKLKVSLVITLALSILFLTVFFAGSIERTLSPKAELKAQIKNVKGLRKGAPVWISGIEVGSVKDINLHPEYGTIVTLSLNKNVLKFLRKDAEASILTMGLLGDKYIELSNGSPGAEPLRPNDIIKGSAQIELQDVVETSASSIEKMSDFINKLDNFITRIEKGEGTIAKFLTDPSLYNKLVSTTAALEEVSRKLNDSSGTVKKLLEDPSLYNRMLAAASSLDDFSKKLNEGQGTLRMLVEEPDLYENLNKVSKQLSSLLGKIESGKGVAGDLITDEKLANDLKDTIVELRDLTKDMKENPRKYFKFSLF